MSRAREGEIENGIGTRGETGNREREEGMKLVYIVATSRPNQLPDHKIFYGICTSTREVALLQYQGLQALIPQISINSPFFQYFDSILHRRVPIMPILEPHFSVFWGILPLKILFSWRHCNMAALDLFLLH